MTSSSQNLCSSVWSHIISWYIYIYIYLQREGDQKKFYSIKKITISGEVEMNIRRGLWGWKSRTRFNRIHFKDTKISPNLPYPSLHSHNLIWRDYLPNCWINFKWLNHSLPRHEDWVRLWPQQPQGERRLKTYLLSEVAGSHVFTNYYWKHITITNMKLK